MEITDFTMKVWRLSAKKLGLNQQTTDFYQ
jgi:hypothetical protein